MTASSSGILAPLRPGVEADRLLERERRLQQPLLGEGRARRSGSRPAARGPPPSGSASPAGIEIAGIPASGIGTVKKSFMYIASGSSVFAPSSKATEGEVGVTTKSKSEKTAR